MGGAWPAQVSHQEVIVQSARLRPLWVWASSSRGGKQSGCPVGAALPRRSLWNKRGEGIRGQGAVVGTQSQQAAQGRKRTGRGPRAEPRASPVNRKVPTQTTAV